MPIQVRKWKASDGNLYDSKKEAELVDVRQNLVDGIFKVSLTNNLTRKDVANLLYENTENIYDLLGAVIRQKKAIIKSKIKAIAKEEAKLAVLTADVSREDQEATAM